MKKMYFCSHTFLFSLGIIVISGIVVTTTPQELNPAYLFGPRGTAATGYTEIRIPIIWYLNHPEDISFSNKDEGRRDGRIRIVG